MSLNDEMTGLMNAVRDVSGTTDKLGVEDATVALSKLSLFHFETVGGNLADAGNVPIDIVAPQVNNYTFVFWLNSSSIYNVSSSYVEVPTQSTTHIWAINGVKGERFQAIAVYVKSGFANVVTGS